MACFHALATHLRNMHIYVYVFNQDKNRGVHIICSIRTQAHDDSKAREVTKVLPPSQILGTPTRSTTTAAATYPTCIAASTDKVKLVQPSRSYIEYQLNPTSWRTGSPGHPQGTAQVSSFSSQSQVNHLPEGERAARFSGVPSPWKHCSVSRQDLTRLLLRGLESEEPPGLRALQQTSNLLVFRRLRHRNRQHERINALPKALNFLNGRPKNEERRNGRDCGGRLNDDDLSRAHSTLSVHAASPRMKTCIRSAAPRTDEL